ncbi:helix-turn-helix domain-containing protein [Piscinibacterium candidicorallinum]|uniref:Helix-turn-helix domain-containing protein n=1 Tax=Piscinibacterium candidicorallinum TaxID=1793872 RepID=A0ABV7H3C1_9BURK
MEGRHRLAEVVAENVRRLMNASTQLNSNQKLASAAGLGHGTIDRLRRGEGNLTIESLAAIADALGTEPWQLLVANWKPSSPPVLLEGGDRELALFKRFTQLCEDIHKRE